MNPGIILLIAFAIVITIMIVVVTKTLKKMKSEDGGTVASTEGMKTAQEFLPFVDIEDGVIDLGGFKYRMIIECSSINYNLKTNTEQNIVEGSFRKFLNSINYPISFFIQTKEINYGTIISSLKKDIEETLEVYPQLRDYAEVYFDEIKHMKQSIDNTKQKKKYIIIPYEEAITMNELSSDEKKSYSMGEIHNRASQIIDGVNGLGLVARALNTNDIIELFYSINHRDDDSFGETIGTGDYLADIVGKENFQPEKTDELKAAIEILQEAENRIRVNILDHRLTNNAMELFTAIAQDMSKMKRGLIDIEENGGYDSLKSLEELFDEGEDVSRDGDDEVDNEPVRLDISKYKRGGDD